MHRFRWYHLALMLLLVPRTSFALDLRWSNGASDLTFTEATRCTLVVQARSTEESLPPDSGWPIAARSNPSRSLA